jgi:transcriptional regulator with XRE-family HTH domain
MKRVEGYLRTWRSANGFTQEQAADRLCVSQSTYHKWESGKSAIPFKYYATIAKVIAVKLSDLVLDSVIAEVSDAQSPQSGFKLEVKDFLRVLEENNGLLKLRCERLAEENKSLKEELRKCSGSQ